MKTKKRVIVKLVNVPEPKIKYVPVNYSDEDIQILLFKEYGTYGWLRFEIPSEKQSLVKA